MTAPLGPHGPALHGGLGRAAVRRRSALRRLRHPLAAGLTGSAVVAWLGVTDPYRPGGHLGCPVLALTGFYCAGCGAQRAVHDLAHLDLVAAWAMNPLLVLAVPFALLLWVRWARRVWSGSGGPVPHPVARPVEARLTTAWLVSVVVVGFAVLRNVPVLQPWLAP